MVLTIPLSFKYTPNIFPGIRQSRVFEMSIHNPKSLGRVAAAPILLPEGAWHQVCHSTDAGIRIAIQFLDDSRWSNCGTRIQSCRDVWWVASCRRKAGSFFGAFTTNIVAAAPVVYCKRALDSSATARAVLINAGQANAATGDEGYQDVLDCSNALAQLLQLRPEEVLIESTGVIGQRIKKAALLASLPNLVNLLSSTTEGADSAAVAITTTDLVSKSVAIESEVGGARVRIGGMAKGSGMIHPNMATMLGVVTTDALVTSDVWRNMVVVAVNRSFNQITYVEGGKGKNGGREDEINKPISSYSEVDGDTSTNDAVIALASGLSGSKKISTIDSSEAKHLQACLDAVMQGLAKSIASDGEGATCLIEVRVTGANSETEAAKVARSVASSSLVKAAIYGRDPNWDRIACAAGYAGISFNPDMLRILLGNIPLMEKGQPLKFDRIVASNYLKKAGETHGTVEIFISIGDGPGSGVAWGCDLSYDYVKINAEYTT